MGALQRLLLGWLPESAGGILVLAGGKRGGQSNHVRAGTELCVGAWGVW